MIKAVWYFI